MRPIRLRPAAGPEPRATKSRPTAEPPSKATARPKWAPTRRPKRTSPKPHPPKHSPFWPQHRPQRQRLQTGPCASPARGLPNTSETHPNSGTTPTPPKYPIPNPACPPILPIPRPRLSERCASKRLFEKRPQRRPAASWATAQSTTPPTPEPPSPTSAPSTPIQRPASPIPQDPWPWKPTQTPPNSARPDRPCLPNTTPNFSPSRRLVWDAHPVQSGIRA